MIPKSRRKISKSSYLTSHSMIPLLKLISWSRVTVDTVPDDKPKTEHINLNKNLDAK